MDASSVRMADGRGVRSTLCTLWAEKLPNKT